MPTTLHQEGAPLVRHGEVTSPDWKLVLFEVSCARCGHDLRGLTEPKCPSCELEFEWSQAVPIEQLVCRKCGYHLYGLTETRCPECGEPFTWAGVLDDYHRKRKPLFEYHWRDRPFRSLVYTWSLALRPWKLWRLIDIHDRPRVGPLLVIVAVAAITLIVAGFVPRFLEEVVDYWRFSRQMAARGRPVQGPIGLLPQFARFALEYGPPYEFVRTVGVWSAFNVASLLVFQQSMRRCKVRAVHVFRVCVYAVIGIAPIAAFVVVAVETLFRAFDIYARGIDLPVVAFFLVVAYGACCVALGYRRYIRMPHSVGVVIAAQVVALLASAITCMWFFLSPRGVLEVVLEWLDSW